LAYARYGTRLLTDTQADGLGGGEGVREVTAGRTIAEPEK
jgi:hypothetical protein